MPVREHYRALGTPVIAIDGARAPRDVEAELVARRARRWGNA